AEPGADRSPRASVPASEAANGRIAGQLEVTAGVQLAVVDRQRVPLSRHQRVEPGSKALPAASIPARDRPQRVVVNGTVTSRSGNRTSGGDQLSVVDCQSHYPVDASCAK